MRVHRRRIPALIVSIFTLALPSLLTAQAPPVEHPLQGLTSQEYWVVHKILQATGKIDADTYAMSVLLHEPPKDQVLAWKAGDPITREADVVLMRKGVVSEVRVDLTQRKTEFWKEVQGATAPIFLSELLALGEIGKNDSRMQAGFAKRGIKDMSTVQCAPLPFGYFALPELEGHRILYGGCSDQGGEFLTWGRAI